MTKVQRFNSFMGGLLMIVFGVFLFIHHKDAIDFIAVVVSIYLITVGIKNIIFYFKMSRYMVGGARSLFTGIILTDLGLYALMLQEMPSVYIILYLLAIHAFSGAVDILEAVTSLRSGHVSWRLKLLAGLGNFALAVVAVVYGLMKGNINTVVYIYGAGVCYSGFMRMINAFKRTAITYIQ